MITVPEHAKTKRIARERKTEPVMVKETEAAVEMEMETAAAEEETDKLVKRKTCDCDCMYENREAVARKESLPSCFC